MNSKKDKIELLKSVMAGRIKPEEISANPMIISNTQDVWVGSMVGTAQEERGEKDSVVFVGEARRELLRHTDTIMELEKKYREEDELKTRQN